MKNIKFYVLALVAAVVFASCGTTRTVPITGRKQTLLVSDEQVLSLSSQEYTKYMATAKKSTNTKNTEMVKRVGQRLANAVTTYLNNNGLSNEVKQFSWEFNLVQDQSINAFCMPGGKIVVYEGLLPVTKDEASLAIVLGHEIAHAVAKHSAEQMSKQIRNQYGTQILGGVLSAAGASYGTQQIAQVIAQQGLQFRSLKYSRDNESEADHMGLIFAAMAGYDPQVATTFWQRMAAQGSGSSSLFSDHPSDATRIKQIQGWMPEALKYYKGGSSASSSATSAPKTGATFHIGSKKK